MTSGARRNAPEGHAPKGSSLIFPAISSSGASRPVGSQEPVTEATPDGTHCKNCDDRPEPGRRTFDLPMPPSLWRLYQGNGPRRTKSTEYRKWIREAGWILVAQRNQGGKHTRINGPVEVTVEAYRPASNRRDLDNILKALLDLLGSTDTIEDDRQVVAINARWVESGPPCVLSIQPAERATP